MKKGTLNPIRSKRFNVLVKHKDVSYMLFNLKFHTNSDGKFAMFVNFPYFSNNQGILSKITFPKNRRKVEKMSLVPTGKLASHYVKYSHWEDGNSHFSQDGKVLSIVRNESNPLNATAGHVFTIMLQNIGGFVHQKLYVKKSSQNEVDIDFEFKDVIPDSMKLTGWWIEAKNTNQSLKEGGPQAQIKMSNGEYKTGFILSPPDGSKFNQYFLFLSCEAIDRISKRNGTALTFIGGFQKGIASNDLSSDLSFLTFIYPAYGYNRLLQRIENIDFKHG